MSRALSCRPTVKETVLLKMKVRTRLCRAGGTWIRIRKGKEKWYSDWKCCAGRQGAKRHDHESYFVGIMLHRTATQHLMSCEYLKMRKFISLRDRLPQSQISDFVLCLDIYTMRIELDAHQISSAGLEKMQREVTWCRMGPSTQHTR